MKRWIHELASRFRAAAQRLPGIGTAVGSISLQRNPNPATHVEKFKIYDAAHIELMNDRATPAAVTYSYADKYAYLLRNVTLWPDFGVVVDDRRRLIEESIFSPDRLRHLSKVGAFRAFPIQEIEGLTTTLQIGSYWDNYYHWLIDQLPRVFALHSPQVAELGRIKLLISGELTGDRRRLLTALLPSYVEVVSVPARARIRPESFLLLPYPSGDEIGYLPPEYLAFFRHRAFAEYDIRPAAARRRILISRRLAATRRLLNQDELEARLAPYGFTSVELERLPFAEQMQLFAEAECIVGSTGAGLTNMLFAPPCRVLVLFAGRPFLHYRLLAAALGHDYANLVGAAAEKNADFAPAVEAILEVLRSWGIAD